MNENEPASARPTARHPAGNPSTGRPHGARPRNRRRAWPIPTLALTALLGTALALLPTGCSRDKQGPPGQGGSGGRGGRAGAAMTQGGPGGTPQLPTVPVAVEGAGLGTISSYYSATAILEPEKQADVLARVPGVILRIETEEGDLVHKGETLLQIEDAEYRYRLEQAEAELAKQKTIFARTEKMHESELVSSEQFESAKNDLATAQAARDLAALEHSYTLVTAPFTGRVTRRAVDQGQTVANGTVLFTLADTERLLARVHVPAKEFRSIRTDQPVELTVDPSPDRLSGKIELVSPVVDPTTGTIKVTVAVDEYPPSVRPGDFAEVRIVTESHDRTILVPKSAVLTEKGDRVVYVAADTTAERRIVQIGFQDDDHIEIVDGLDEGERVVIQGQRSLKDGQPIKILDRLEFQATEADSTTAGRTVS